MHHLSVLSLAPAANPAATGNVQPHCMPLSHLGRHLVGGTGPIICVCCVGKCTARVVHRRTCRPIESREGDIVAELCTLAPAGHPLVTVSAHPVPLAIALPGVLYTPMHTGKLWKHRLDSFCLDHDTNLALPLALLFNLLFASRHA